MHAMISPHHPEDILPRTATGKRGLLDNYTKSYMNKYLND
jgi:hypothetical protein